MELQDVMQSKNTVKKRLSEVEAEMNVLKNKQTTLWKAMAHIHKNLHSLCNHEWIRESYQYSSLYCKICGVEK